MSRIVLLLITFSFMSACQPTPDKHNLKIKQTPELFSYNQLRLDTLFDSNQIISLLSINKSNLDKVNFTICQHPSDLIPTSEFGQRFDLLAAINGGFFDMANGGSVAYLEIADSTLAYTKNHEIFNGAVVLSDETEMSIELAKSDSFYQNSPNESAVLVTGPILLLDGFKAELPDRDLVTVRHPRTCICETQTSFLFLTIDGRTMEAAGMTLMELQDFLMGQDCIDAINLDGGGSTTMWMKNKGVLNYPSDITGERPVANILAISIEN